MYTSKKQRLAALLVCVGMTASVLLALAFIVHHTVHDCDGDHCSVCMEIRALSATIRQKLVSRAVISSVTYIVVIATASIFLTNKFFSANSPVDDKVRIDC